MRNELVYCIEEANKMKKIRAIILTGDPVSVMYCCKYSLERKSILFWSRFVSTVRRKPNDC